MSSMISLMAIAASTSVRGTIVVKRPVGETPGSCWRGQRGRERGEGRGEGER